jgi:hypothetical protein
MRTQWVAKRKDDQERTEELPMFEFGRDDHAAAGSLRADEFRRDLLALRVTMPCRA